MVVHTLHVFWHWQCSRQHVAVALALTLVALLTSLYFVYYYELCIGVTSYGALGHVPPLELGHVKKIWQFLRQ